MSFKLSYREAGKIQVGDRVVCIDGQRRFVSDIHELSSGGVRIVYADGWETVASKSSEMTVADWHEEETGA